MNLTPRYWWRKWCNVWRAWHFDIDDGKHYITFVINVEVSGSANSTSLSSSISRCQAHQTLHPFRHQYRGVRLIKLYITFVINIEVSGSSNSTSLSSSISRCQAPQTLHQFRHQCRGVRLGKLYITFVINIEVLGSSNFTCNVWRAWHLGIDDESQVDFEEPDTSILMTKVM
jgi:hypothetical protein